MTAVADAGEIRVRVAEYAVGRGAALLTTVGLGSCVAIMLYDAATRIGGMAHVLLPEASAARPDPNPAKFPGTAVPLLVEQLRALGAVGALKAKIAGGASMFSSLLAAGGGTNIGERNVDATVRALATAGVPLLAQDTGGDYGRSVTLELTTGRVLVRSLKRGNVVI